MPASNGPKLIIGLTGGIASGKTTVSSFFEQLGVPVIDADIISRELVNHPGQIADAIIEHFGTECASPDGSVNRGKVREIVFSDDAERLWLENLIHPAVQTRIHEEISSSSARYLIVSVPLLLEKSSYDFIDMVLVVDASEDSQLDRASRRDGVSLSDIASIIKTQMPRNQKLAMANDIIHNDNDLNTLKQQVLTLHERYCEIADRHQES